MFTADGFSNRFNSVNGDSENHIEEHERVSLLDLENLARKNMGFRERADLSSEDMLEFGVNGFGLKPSDGNIKRMQSSDFSDGGLGVTPLKMGYCGRVDEETSVKVEKMGNLTSQELTLSYMCDSLKMGSSERGKDFWSSIEESQTGLGKGKYKGKEVVDNLSNEKSSDDGSARWVERDFLQLTRDDGGAGSENKGLKRETTGCEDELEECRKIEKKAKLETLNLSLGLPDVSLTLASSNPSNGDPPPVVLSKRTRSIQSMGLSNNNTRASSDDFTASLSYSYSHPFSHNPSCSLNPNSTENYEYSVGSQPGSRRDNDHIWYCGEGTNGSVHSRFKPIGDVPLLQRLQNGVLDGEKDAQFVASRNNSERDQAGSKKVEGINFSRHGYPMMNGQPNGPEKSSFFPSELPARLRKDTQSVDSREKLSEHHKISENGGRNSLNHRNWNQIDAAQPQPSARSRTERILHEIVSESIPIVAQILQELPNGLLEDAKDYLKNLIGSPEKREELAILQSRLERRSDLTFETLSKCYKTQLDILVALKTGIPNYLSGSNRLPTAELIEIFLLSRCRNVDCKNSIPVDECDCKLCSTKKGFCSACMCQICFNFDCALNTCSWVGCDVCSHWCHAVCGIQTHHIRPGPSLSGVLGATEMQFQCLGCGHSSEMFGFVKEVFKCCAKSWSPDALVKELDCVKIIFQGSEDLKGKELRNKAEEMLTKLNKQLISPSDACDNILVFFNEGLTEFSNRSSKDFVQTNQRGLDISVQASSALTIQGPSYNLKDSSGGRREDLHRNSSLQNGERDVVNGSEPKLQKDDVDSLESIVRIKEAEARMFQSRADDARREAEGLRQIVRVKSQKLEEEYTCKMARLCLQETEERRRKKVEELKVLENSHCDYYNMKMRMEGEIAGLLERMEATKQQWV